jgi:hypothetical protein
MYALDEGASACRLLSRELNVAFWTAVEEVIAVDTSDVTFPEEEPEIGVTAVLTLATTGVANVARVIAFVNTTCGLVGKGVE